jgi:LysM repeat protein
MSPLIIPKLGGTVGGSKAKNDAADVKIVQGLLNDAIDFGDPAMHGLSVLAVDGKVSTPMLKMIQQYQRFKGLGPPPKFEDVLVEPGKGTMRNLAKNPYVDARWSEWDDDIQTEVNAYNKEFASSPGYSALDWRLIKAQVWTEVKAGPDDAQWSSRPMQIGRFAADKGMQVIRDGKDHSDLITDKKLRDDLAKNSTGTNNIRAGIAYDVHLDATYKLVEVIDDPAVKVHTLAKGETPEKVAAAENTTVHNLMSLNGLTQASATKLQLGAKLKFQLAHNEWQIVDWGDWMDAVEAYNGGGDASYMTKIADNLAKVKKRW